MSDSYGADQVKLKAFFGVRPGVWLFCLLCLALFALLCGVFVLPGLSRNGSVVSFASEPFGAAVFVDGVYRESTPGVLFVPRGKHVFEVSLPGFSPKQFEEEIPGRVFGSLFFPRRVSFSVPLVTEDPVEVLRQAAAEYARWTFGGEPQASWQAPLALSEGVYRAGSGGIDPALRAALKAILRESRGYAVTRAAARDLVRAELLLGNGGNPPSPVTLVRSVREMLLDVKPGTAGHLAGLLDGESATAIKASRWFAGEAERTVSPRAEMTRENPPEGRTITLGGLEFVYVDGGKLFTADGAFPGGRAVAGFWISRNEVSEAVFNRFLAENPGWGSGAREELIRQNLVTDAFLETYSGETAAGVAGISWFAAHAFTAWLSSGIQAPRPGKAALEARLPTEHEWEYAARAAELPGGAALENIAGGLWEWCGDYHVPLAFFAAEDVPGQIVSPERNVRGGSWVNPPRSVGTESRASLSPETCSPFVGFRPVLVRKAP